MAALQCSYLHVVDILCDSCQGSHLGSLLPLIQVGCLPRSESALYKGFSPCAVLYSCSASCWPCPVHRGAAMLQRHLCTLSLAVFRTHLMMEHFAAGNKLSTAC